MEDLTLRKFLLWNFIHPSIHSFIQSINKNSPSACHVPRLHARCWTPQLSKTESLLSRQSQANGQYRQAPGGLGCDGSGMGSTETRGVTLSGGLGKTTPTSLAVCSSTHLPSLDCRGLITWKMRSLKETSPKAHKWGYRVLLPKILLPKKILKMKKKNGSKHQEAYML